MEADFNEVVNFTGQRWQVNAYAQYASAVEVLNPFEAYYIRRENVKSGQDANILPLSEEKYAILTTDAHGNKVLYVTTTSVKFASTHARECEYCVLNIYTEQNSKVWTQYSGPEKKLLKLYLKFHFEKKQSAPVDNEKPNWFEMLMEENPFLAFVVKFWWTVPFIIFCRLIKPLAMDFTWKWTYQFFLEVFIMYAIEFLKTFLGLQNSAYIQWAIHHIWMRIGAWWLLELAWASITPDNHEFLYAFKIRLERNIGDIFINNIETLYFAFRVFCHML
jgi:hypothetical protein